MRSTIVFTSGILCCATAVGLFAFALPRQAALHSEKQAQTKTQNAPQELSVPRLLRETNPRRDVRSLNWLADNRRLWIVKTEYGKGRSSITTWDVSSDKKTTLQAPPACGGQNFLPTSDGTLAVGFGYANQPNTLWKPGAKTIVNAGDINPLSLTHQFLIGWKMDREGIKLEWRTVKSNRVENSFHIQVPRGYNYYVGGHCGELGPFVQLSENNKIGFLGLFADDFLRHVLVFDARTGKKLRVLKLANAPDEINGFFGFRSTRDGKHLLIYKSTLLKDLESYKRALEWRDAATGRLLHSWPVEDESDVEIFDDSSLFATYFSKQNAVRIYDTQSGALRREIKCQSKETRLQNDVMMKFSHDNRYLATTDKDFKKGDSVTVWRLR